jgi:hypothetical protein
MTGSSEPPLAGAPRMSRARAVVVVVIGLLATGVLIGGLWAWIAPAIHGVVAVDHTGERVHDYLGAESEHFFVAAFLTLGLLSVVSVVAPVLVWQWREHRGPGMVAGLSIGLVVAAPAAVAVGAPLVRLRYGVVDFAGAPLTDDHPVYYFTQGPPVFFARPRCRSPLPCCCRPPPPRWCTPCLRLRPRATTSAATRLLIHLSRQPR